jgi:hypothetical protein
MKSESNTLYTLRIWSEDQEWRATLTDAVTLEKQHFASVEALNMAIQRTNQRFDSGIFEPELEF